MAYKDEYEVARLHAAPEFMNKLRAQFDGEPGKDYSLGFYLAPPLLSRRDEKGQLVKRRFGPWVLPMFRALAKCKGLRGTALDIFGRTHERRTERRLIGEYIALVDEFCVSLTDANRESRFASHGYPMKFADSATLKSATSQQPRRSAKR